MSTLFISTESNSSLSLHSWLPAQFLSAAITKYPRPRCVLRMEMTLLAILEAGVLKTKVVLTSSRGRRAREDRAQPLHEGWRPTHTGCDVRTFFFFSNGPTFSPGHPTEHILPCGFWRTVQISYKRLRVPGCLALAHPSCSEANSLPRLLCFLRVLFIYLFCFLETRSYSVAQEGMQLTMLPRMTSN